MPARSSRARPPLVGAELRSAAKARAPALTGSFPAEIWRRVALGHPARAPSPRKPRARAAPPRGAHLRQFCPPFLKRSSPPRRAARGPASQGSAQGQRQGARRPRLPRPLPWRVSPARLSARAGGRFRSRESPAAARRARLRPLRAPRAAPPPPRGSAPRPKAKGKAKKESAAAVAAAAAAAAAAEPPKGQPRRAKRATRKPALLPEEQAQRSKKGPSQEGAEARLLLFTRLLARLLVLQPFRCLRRERSSTACLSLQALAATSHSRGSRSWLRGHCSWGWARAPARATLLACFFQEAASKRRQEWKK